MPVVALDIVAVERRRVDEEVVGRPVERALDLEQRRLEARRQLLDLVARAVLEVGGVALREDPRLEREPRGERLERDEGRALADDPRVGPELLADHVAEEAAAAEAEIVGRPRHLLRDGLRDRRRADELAVAVLDARARG